MKKNLVLLMIASLFLLVGCGNTSELEEQVEELQSINSELEGEVSRLESEIETLNAEIAELTAEPEAPEFELEDLMGIWTNGSGDSLNGVIRQGAFEFEEDFTFTSYSNDIEWHIENDSSGTTAIWQLNDAGNIVIGDAEWRIEINGNLLTITDEDGSVRMFQRFEGEVAADVEDTEPVDEPEDTEPEPEDTEETEEASSSSTSDDWRQFLVDYDAWMTRFIANPTDLTLLTESVEWLERTAEIQETLSGDDSFEFSMEILRIAGRALE